MIAVSLLLSSCAVSVQPAADIEMQSVGVMGGQTVNERLGLRGYPGATVVKQEQDRDSSRTTFETSASLDAVYNHFHGQLRGQGWQRGELESKRNKVEAEYYRGGEEVELKLHREGNSGRYRLELKLDD